MHILVIGGSGRIGKLVIEEALRRGHTVTALLRDETKLEKKDGLTIVKGDPKLSSDLPPAFTPTPDAVITTLAARRQTDSPFSQPSAESPPRLLADIHANLTSQIRQQQTKKLVILSMAGCADSRAGLPLVTKALFAWSPMRHQLVDHGLVDAETRKASRESKDNGGGGFDFTLVRPVMFTVGDAAKVKVWPESASGVGLTSKITRKSVASFMVDAAEKDEWNGKAPVISN